MYQMYINKIDNILHPLNIESIFLTLEVLKEDIFKIVNEEQYRNIPSIVNTDDVSKFVKFNIVKELQELNIKAIFVIFNVPKLDISNSFKFEQLEIKLFKLKHLMYQNYLN